MEKQLTDILPPGSNYEFHVTSRVVSAVELSVKPESVALGAFGAIAALVALVLSAQAISRQLRVGDDDRRVCAPWGRVRPSPPVKGSSVCSLRSFSALCWRWRVAVALSPLAPLGPVRPSTPMGGSRSTGRC